MRNLLFIFLLLVIFDAQAKEISLSFDDAPKPDGLYFTGKRRAEVLLESLSQSGVKRVAFYLNPFRMKEGEPTERVRIYSANGHVLGNHTFDHGSLSQIGAPDFIQSIEKAHKIIKDLPGFKPWFRYPFLDQGKTIEERDSVYQALDRLGYLDAYITIDSYDWFMNQIFQEALSRKETVNFKKLEKVYVETISELVDTYDTFAKKFLGRSPRHVLVGSSRVDLQACKLEYSIVSPK